MIAAHKKSARACRRETRIPVEFGEFELDGKSRGAGGGDLVLHVDLASARFVDVDAAPTQLLSVQMSAYLDHEGDRVTRHADVSISTALWLATLAPFGILTN